MKNVKTTLRKKFRAIRSKIPTAYCEQAAQSAAQLFCSKNIFKTSQHIACYLPIKDEFDSSVLIEKIWQAKKHCYLPVLTKDGKALYFVPYQYGDALHPNRYGILEPINTTHPYDPKKLDIVLTPLLAYDKNGHRLGTGGGYYDRTFAFLLKDNTRKPLMIGVAYAVQQAEDVPSEPWDILLNAVITEKNFLVCHDEGD